MKYIKKLIMTLIIGGIAMTILAGCDKRNNREWLENKFGTELSRVYPTEDLTALFQEFPEGFKIYQTNTMKNYDSDIELYGYTEDKSIKGTITQIDRETNEKVTVVQVEYKDGQYIFSDNAKAKELWPSGHFLFQHMTIDKAFLSKLDLTDKGYSFQNGDFHLNYTITNKTVNDYLQLARDKELTFELGGSNSNRGYYYSVIFEDGNDSNYYFRETISE